MMTTALRTIAFTLVGLWAGLGASAQTGTTGQTGSTGQSGATGGTGVTGQSLPAGQTVVPTQPGLPGQPGTPGNPGVPVQQQVQPMQPGLPGQGGSAAQVWRGGVVPADAYWGNSWNWHDGTYRPSFNQPAPATRRDAFYGQDYRGYFGQPYRGFPANRPQGQFAPGSGDSSRNWR